MQIHPVFTSGICGMCVFSLRTGCVTGGITFRGEMRGYGKSKEKCVLLSELRA